MEKILANGVVLNRRALLLSALLLGASSQAAQGGTRPNGTHDIQAADPERFYVALEDNGFNVPSVRYRKLDPRFWRRRVIDLTGATEGTVFVSLAERFLYFVIGDGTAIRYGIAIGKDGYRWSGNGEIARIATWPKWTPTMEMRARLPELERYRSGMPGGPENPLGARTLYIHRNGKDTLYRVHGTPEWWSIGRQASSGCIRMLNQDVIDLAARVQPGAAIIVL
ncbi:L,D-transpeptidase [Ciceribacter sp. L1K22]|uniref:L,D-transpeptidase n=1 Tax=Ciceribacter sp. L1K22 TaxID=2820275 RepID=UPI001ABE4927|nr:L,D-transpeptidase [Ciceribacter sp. L1K22]MBO3761513.1 L,D-transpeptidase [Ciceribacter sp. L1K22]